MPSIPSSPFKSRQSVGPSSAAMGLGTGSSGMGGPMGLPVPGRRSTSPLPPQLPPKSIDLNSSTRSTDRETGAKVTKRAFLCDVVVEREGEETINLLAQLGETVRPLSALPTPPPPMTSRPASPSSSDDDERTAPWSVAKREDMSKRVRSLIDELVRTERSYVSRIRALKTSYADPLRHFAKQGYSVIIPMYEAKTLFANIDAVLLSATVLLADLEAMWDSGMAEDNVGDVCLKHFRDLKTFDPYRTYLSKQDESQKTFQEMIKKVPTFGSFIESTKYQTTGIGNIGLRELLMEPVQRIPRYTLLWSTMIKYMPPLSTQRAKLVEAIEIASRIARCEADAQTVRATIMYCLQRNVENFPANLFSNNRDYIDSIDVEDVPSELVTSPHKLNRVASRPMSITSATSTSTPSLASLGSTASSAGLPSPQKDMSGSNGGAPQPLHCTLFLFDDKLMIVKRQSATVSGRKVTGLDDVAKLVRTGGGVAVMDRDVGKKDKLSFRGTVDILDVIAADTGEGDFQLFLERPPMDQSDRWSARPFRSYTTVQPPYAVVLDPSTARRDKLRFVQNLWAAQALARAKRLPTTQARAAPPRVLKGTEEISLEMAGEALARARCYFDVWQRGSWTAETKKAKVAIHIDEDGYQPDLALVDDDSGVTVDPRLVIRLQPMPGGMCRFSYATSMGESDERTVVASTDVAERIITTIGKLNIFKFRTAANSAPATPSSTAHRLRPTMLNLDTISRNLFGAGSVSTRGSMSAGSGDAFGGGSVVHGSASTKRTRSVASRSSHADSGVGGSMSSSNRLSVEMRSAASSDSHGSGGERGQNAGHSSTRPLSRSSLSPSPGLAEHPDEAEEDLEILVSPFRQGRKSMDASEVDLNERLNLARKNSKTMAALMSPKGGMAAGAGAGMVVGVAGSSAGVARGRKEVPKVEEDEWAQAEAEIRAALGSTSTTHTPTAPLRIVKTPSPTRALRGDTPRGALPSASMGAGASRTPTASSSRVMSPREYGSPEPMSPTRLVGPRSPVQANAQLPMVGGYVPPPPPVSSASGVPLVRAPTITRGPLPPTPTRPALSPINTDGAPLASASRAAIGPGSGHTRLRVVSGNGRRVSLGRETVPLKGEDDVDERRASEGTLAPVSAMSTPHAAARSSAYSSIALSPLSPISPFTVPSALPLPTPRGSVSKPSGTPSAGGGGGVGVSGQRVVSAGKRQHSGDDLSNGPRKRSPSRSPLHPRVDENRHNDDEEGEGDDATMGEPLKVPSLRSKESRRVSAGTAGYRAGRKVSGGVGSASASLSGSGGTTPRKMSAGGSGIGEDGREETDAIESMKRKINDSRATVRRLKADAAALRKHVASSRERERDGAGGRREKTPGAGAAAAVAVAMGSGIDRNPSLPRSPQSRNIHRQVDYISDAPSPSPVRGGGGSGSGKAEFDAIVIDEHVRGIVATLDRLESSLRGVLADAEKVEREGGDQGDDERKLEIASLESQLGRAKEREELVRQQLAASQIEVEEIYKAFNTELDAMFADAQIRPETEALQVARKQVQKALEDRNALDLENRRLKAELEEEKLKREQWAKMLRAQGLIP